MPPDSSRGAQVEALRDTVYERFGPVDILVNNAGGRYPALPSTVTDNGWRSVADGVLMQTNWVNLFPDGEM